ncbi:hypothetical protein M0R88_11680 [Halorussus gelatinilyticus]|uniref:DUF7344 domain-containing protein n=1 Tax=Halorussus gelatinilyticus TaxID=2937524 RepID=A0A8U0IES4_9EURY|nr:hypothetical protein [Halorussus gelatinilyticus]UPV99185.1 hypothetical protein M0R88_11680 [Halorussus gelatinilyticus]
MVHQDRTTVSERIDRSCELLRSAYRRRIIYALRRGGPASVGELADVVTAVGLVEDRQRAIASLVHTHLPKLSEAGVIEYEGAEETVSLAESVEELEPLLTVAARQEVDNEHLPFSGGNRRTDAVAGKVPE